MSIFSTPGVNDSISPPGVRTLSSANTVDGQAQIQAIENKWIAVQELKKGHKLTIKQYASLVQGHEIGRALCYFCHKQFGYGDLEIHHKDHNKRNNQLSNVTPACGPCNNEERAQWLAVENKKVRTPTDTLLTQQKQTDEGVVVQKQHDESETLKRAPWPCQKKVGYRHKALVHLIRLIKAGVLDNGREFDTLVYDIETLSGCSHDKAIEYLNGWSISSYAPLAKYRANTEGEDPNEIGSGEFMIKAKKDWNQEAYATDEYKKALAEVERGAEV